MNGLSESRSCVTPARSVTCPCACAVPTTAKGVATRADAASSAPAHRRRNSTTYHLFLHDCEEITIHRVEKSMSTGKSCQDVTQGPTVVAMRIMISADMEGAT